MWVIAPLVGAVGSDDVAYHSKQALKQPNFLLTLEIENSIQVGPELVFKHFYSIENVRYELF